MWQHCQVLSFLQHPNSATLFADDIRASGVDCHFYAQIMQPFTKNRFNMYALLIFVVVNVLLVSGRKIHLVNVVGTEIFVHF